MTVFTVGSRWRASCAPPQSGASDQVPSPSPVMFAEVGKSFDSLCWLSVSAAVTSSTFFFLLSVGLFFSISCAQIVLLFPALRRTRSYLTASKQVVAVFYGASAGLWYRSDGKEPAVFRLLGWLHGFIDPMAHVRAHDRALAWCNRHMNCGSAWKFKMPLNFSNLTVRMKLVFPL